MALAQERTPRVGVIAEDFFREGTCGWVQLISSQAGAGAFGNGVVMYDSSYGMHDGGGSLVLETGDQVPGGANDARGVASAIKRLWRGSSYHLAGSIDLQFGWYYASQYDQNNPRAIEFGLDCASPTATPRYFFRTRWLNYDVVGGSRVTKYQILVNGTWTDIPAAAWQTGAGTGSTTGNLYPHGWNENKRDWHLLRLRLDVKNGKYLGMQIDGDPFGIYADEAAGIKTGDGPEVTAWRALGGPQAESLPTFENGFNGFLSIENRSDNRRNAHGWAGLGYFRAETDWEL